MLYVFQELILEFFFFEEKSLISKIFRTKSRLNTQRKIYELLFKWNQTMVAMVSYYLT